jgi:hypothetical protein
MTLRQFPDACSVGSVTAPTPFALSEVEAHLPWVTPFDLAHGEREYVG